MKKEKGKYLQYDFTDTTKQQETIKVKPTTEAVSNHKAPKKKRICQKSEHHNKPFISHRGIPVESIIIRFVPKHHFMWEKMKVALQAGSPWFIHIKNKLREKLLSEEIAVDELLHLSALHKKIR